MGDAGKPGGVLGLGLVIDGAKARELDVPLERAAAKKSGVSNYCIPTEPEASEFYLDTLSVSPRYQGKGYGRKLIEAGCDRASKLGHRRMALMVEVDHAPAIRLYEHSGFARTTLGGSPDRNISTWYGVCDAPGACVPCFEWSLLPKVRDIFLYGS
jgi:hypothetical protein